MTLFQNLILFTNHCGNLQEMLEMASFLKYVDLYLTSERGRFYVRHSVLFWENARSYYFKMRHQIQGLTLIQRCRWKEYAFPKRYLPANLRDVKNQKKNFVKACKVCTLWKLAFTFLRAYKTCDCSYVIRCVRKAGQQTCSCREHLVHRVAAVQTQTAGQVSHPRIAKERRNEIMYYNTSGKRDKWHKRVVLGGGGRLFNTSAVFKTLLNVHTAVFKLLWN
jgi:hypothetical protein